ncbi:MAG TPA: Rad52/Rad22 family DNA repair protein [Rubricoccaceae bacterium]|jgi:hypothetical protein
MLARDLPLLAAPFATSDVEWKPGAVTRDKSKGLAMAYLSNRAVQDRLDAVCGPADWRNEYRPGPDGGVVCGLSVYVERDGLPPEWVTKWDGADNTDVEAVKGGLSGSMKRAAVMWGIGRSLYSLPAQWVRLDERGRFAEPPRLPREYASARSAEAPRPSSRPPEAASSDTLRTESRPAARPDATRTDAPRSEPTRGEASRGEAMRPSGPAGTRRIIRPAGRPAEGDGGAPRTEPGF